MPDRTPDDAVALVAAAVWRGAVDSAAGDELLTAAAAYALQNGVAGPLARLYPERLAAQLAEVDAATAAFRTNLAEVCARLNSADVSPVLIKCEPGDDFTYSNFDLVVGDDGWTRSIDALRDWEQRRSSHPLEPDKLIIHPAHGPAAHLHRHASWFGVVAVSAASLRRNATRVNGDPWLLPSPSDRLRLLLAHAAFQNLALDLSEVLTIRQLLTSGGDVEVARRAAAAEGWARGFDDALGVARRAADALDRGEAPRFPAPLRPITSVASGLSHAVHLARDNGQLGMAVRAAALRGPLVIAKARRRWGAERRVRLVGVSGPDGSGKTSLVHDLTAQARSRGVQVTTLHPYGCVICRNWPQSLGRPGFGDEQVAPSARARAVNLAHLLVDAGEFSARVGVARGWTRFLTLAARARGGSGKGLVITDRSPLDALVKHNGTGEWGGRVFLPLTRAYDAILVLDAGSAVLAARDSWHREDQLAAMRQRFRRWASIVPRVREVDTGTRDTTAVAGDVIDHLLGPSGGGDQLLN